MKPKLDPMNNCCILKGIQIEQMKKEIADLRYENMKQYCKIAAQKVLLDRKKKR